MNVKANCSVARNSDNVGGDVVRPVGRGRLKTAPDETVTNPSVHGAGENVVVGDGLAGCGASGRSVAAAAAAAAVAAAVAGVTARGSAETRRGRQTDRHTDRQTHAPATPCTGDYLCTVWGDVTP